MNPQLTETLIAMLKRELVEIKQNKKRTHDRLDALDMRQEEVEKAIEELKNGAD